MRLLLASLLCTLLACSGSEPAKPSAAEASKPAPTESKGGKKRPKNSNPAPVSTGVPVKGQQAIAVVAVEGKAKVVAEGRGATLGMDPERAFWTGTALVVQHNGGLMVYGPGEATWWEPGDLPAGAVSLGTILEASGELGRWVEVETLKAGQKRVWVNISGQRSRLGIFKTEPTASLYLLTPAPVKVGKESIRLGKASGFSFDASGAPAATIPAEATALPVTAPDKATKARWTADLSKLRGAAITLSWATVLDLDHDGEPEGFVCAKGGKDDNDCYAVETAGERTRYHGVSSMRYTGSGAAPLAFDLRSGTYVMQVTGSGDSAALWVARYDGSDYLVEAVR